MPRAYCEVTVLCSLTFAFNPEVSACQESIVFIPRPVLPAALVIVITLFSGILWKLMKNEGNKKELFLWKLS